PRVALKCPAARHHLIEEGAEAEDIGARIYSLALGLLWGHVGGGPDDHTLFSRRLEGTRHVVSTRRRGCGKFGQAEVESLHEPLLVNHHIIWLHVPVNDARLV